MNIYDISVAKIIVDIDQDFIDKYITLHLKALIIEFKKDNRW